ncbi:hypothetical protein [Helicobacter cetorum]|nr:hypothetical protein [Helicobacter cetorum]
MIEKIEQIKTATHSNSYDDKTDDLDNTENLENTNEYVHTPKHRL